MILSMVSVAEAMSTLGTSNAMRDAQLAQVQMTSLGGACTLSEMCEDGLECRGLTCQVPYVLLGGACEASEQCSPSLECRESMCLEPFRMLNEACEQDSQC